MPRDSKTLTLHISKELIEAIDILHAKEDKKTKRDSFIRRKTIEKLQEQVKEYSIWLKNGRRWNFNSVPNEQVQEVIDLQDEPESFGSFEDSEPTKYETEVLEIDYPKFVYEQAYNCASLNIAVKATALKKNPGLAPALKAAEFKTVGEWFKQAIFLPVFMDDSAEKAHYQEELAKFEKEFEEPKSETSLS